MQLLLTTKKALEKLQVDLQNNVADLGAKAELHDSLKSKNFDAKSHCIGREVGLIQSLRVIQNHMNGAGGADLLFI